MSLGPAPPPPKFWPRTLPGATSILTGAVRFRRGWFGRVIPQVEYTTIYLPAGSRSIEPASRWRDATAADFPPVVWTLSLEIEPRVSDAR